LAKSVPGCRVWRLLAYQFAEKGPSAVTHSANGYPERLGTRCGVRVSTPGPTCGGYPAPIQRMGTRRSVLHLDLFEQPGGKRVFQHPTTPRCCSRVPQGEPRLRGVRSARLFVILVLPDPRGTGG
jgi:hypothetical protein